MMAERDRFVLRRRGCWFTYSSYHPGYQISFEKVKWIGVLVGLVVGYVLVPTYGWVLGFG
jgi:hypothetical protein